VDNTNTRETAWYARAISDSHSDGAEYIEAYVLGRYSGRTLLGLSDTQVIHQDSRNVFDSPEAAKKAFEGGLLTFLWE